MRLATNPTRRSWNGTLLEAKRDKAGTFYRRTRAYDPGTGRFTQEDPAGLAGGLNLYGFAAADPVNFADPFGLCACPPDCGFEGDPRNIEREAQRFESLTNHDRLARPGVAGVAVAGGGRELLGQAGGYLRCEVWHDRQMGGRVYRNEAGRFALAVETDWPSTPDLDAARARRPRTPTPPRGGPHC